MRKFFTSIPLWVSVWLMSLCGKTQMQLPLVGLVDWLEGNPNPPKNNEPPGGTEDSIAEAKRLKRAAKKKRHYDRVMADPARHAKKRATANAWRRQHRKKHGSYPTQEALDKQAAVQRRLYHAKYKHSPEWKAKTAERRAKFQSTEHAKEYFRNWTANRRAIDPEYRIYGTLCARLSALVGHRSIRKGTVELLGCSISEFMNHLQSQFQPGMTFDNYGRGIGKWNIDHIRPCASFNLLDPEQQKECFHFSNLRPLWHQENNSKKSFHDGKHWFRSKDTTLYSPEICANPLNSPLALPPTK